MRLSIDTVYMLAEMGDLEARTAKMNWICQESAEGYFNARAGRIYNVWKVNIRSSR